MLRGYYRGVTHTVQAEEDFSAHSLQKTHERSLQYLMLSKNHDNESSRGAHHIGEVVRKGRHGNTLWLSRMASSGKVGAKTTFPFNLTFLGGYSWGQFKANCANTPVQKPHVSSMSQPLLLEVQSAAAWVTPRLPAIPTALADGVLSAEQRDETCRLFVLLLPDATTTMLFVFKIRPSASWPSLSGVSPVALITERCLCCTEGGDYLLLWLQMTFFIPLPWQAYSELISKSSIPCSYFTGQ